MKITINSMDQTLKKCSPVCKASVKRYNNAMQSHPQIHSPSSNNRQKARILFVYFSITFLSSPFISAIVFIILFIDCSDALSDWEIPAIAKHITTTEKFYSSVKDLEKLDVDSHCSKSKYFIHSFVEHFNRNLFRSIAGKFNWSNNHTQREC